MVRTFLEAAEQVLRRKARPMKPQEIFNCASEEGLIFSRGKTPGLSMKARISTDIRKKGFSSKFMRTGLNKFALREFGMKEYIAQPFKKNIPRENVTCIHSSKLTGVNDIFGFSRNVDLLQNLLTTTDNLSFLEREIAELTTEYKQLISYVILIHETEGILTYKRGVFSNAHEMLKGSICLGFGGHVQDIDSTNIFTKGWAGVYDTAEREVYEELKGFKLHNSEIVGFINDDSSPEGLKHLGVVLKSVLPNNFKLSNIGKELSINDLRFMSTIEIWEKFYQFEFWSQLLIKKLFPQAYFPNVVIKPAQFKINSNFLVFVGEIASGKTILCNLLQERHNFVPISTRKCVARLINAKDFGTKDRSAFQKKAQDFISKKNSPFLLAQEIKGEIEATQGPVMIDGIRHYETLQELRKFFPELIVLYVESAKDDAFRNFLKRSGGKGDIEQFRKERFHPVEKEIQLLKGDADAYIFNGGTENDLYNTFINWFNSNKE